MPATAISANRRDARNRSEVIVLFDGPPPEAGPSPDLERSGAMRAKAAPIQRGARGACAEAQRRQAGAADRGFRVRDQVDGAGRAGDGRAEVRCGYSIYGNRSRRSRTSGSNRSSRLPDARATPTSDQETASNSRSGIPAKSRAFLVRRTATVAATVTPIAISAARRRGEPSRRKTSAA